MSVNVLDMFKITKPGAPRITLYGKPGIGKTTLASQFPDPFFILTEDNECPGIMASPIMFNYDDIWNLVKGLLAMESLPFKTLIIDTISKLDHIVMAYTLQQSPPIGVGKERRMPGTLAEAWGGYGAGFEKAAMLHRALKNRFDRFKERGISVIYIAHSEIKKYKSPEHEDYDILSINMNSDKCRHVYVDDVDGVFYCKDDVHIIETESKMSKRNLAKSTGRRVISAQCNEVYVSKNRFNIQNDIPMSFDDLKKYIPFYNQDNN